MFIRKSRRESGFTLIELLATLILLSVLVAVALPKLLGNNTVKQDAKDSFSEQLQTLDTIQKNISTLSEFVERQKNDLKESEIIIAKLRKEKQEIESLVQTDRKTVEAILSLQEKKNRGSAWQGHILGFAVGVLSSLVATLIWEWRKKNA